MWSPPLFKVIRGSSAQALSTEAHSKPAKVSRYQVPNPSSPLKPVLFRFARTLVSFVSPLSDARFATLSHVGSVGYDSDHCRSRCARDGGSERDTLANMVRVSTSTIHLILISLLVPWYVGHSLGENPMRIHSRPGCAYLFYRSDSVFLTLILEVIRFRRRRPRN
jgi:hypothetical protein